MNPDRFNHEVMFVLPNDGSSGLFQEWPFDGEILMRKWALCKANA
jgi:hypothetical protein